MEISCDCEQCQSMCANSTCLPTPEEARELIRKGYGAKLSVYSWGGRSYVAPSPVGKEGVRDLTNTISGACVFFDGKYCELHDKSLKPLEGRLAYHDRDWRPIRLHVMNTWKGRRFDSVKSLLDKSVNCEV